MITKLKEKIEPIRQWIEDKFDLIVLQVLGLVLIGVAYVWLGFITEEQAWTPWLAVLLPVGIIELTTIWVWRSPITKKARTLLKKKYDIIVMIGLIPCTWWWFGPKAAGMLLMGLLLNHFTEKQPKKD